MTVAERGPVSRLVDGIGFDPIDVVREIQDAIDQVHIVYPLESIELDLTTVAGRTGGGGLAVPFLGGQLGANGELSTELTQVLSFKLTPKPPRRVVREQAHLTESLREVLGQLETIAKSVTEGHPEFKVAPSATVTFALSASGDVSFFLKAARKEVTTHTLVVTFQTA